MLLKGDCIEVMKAMKPDSIDAIVTDPPYGLEFMNKDWDKLWRRGDSPAQKDSWGGFFKKNGNPRWRDVKQNEWLQMQLWHTQWLIEAYRVLKPGGSMLVMGGTRTSHRLACAIEDSGFIIKDTLMWIFGSGFPKAQDLGKMIDKRAGLKIENKSEFIGVSKLQDNTKAIKRYKACTECGKPLFGPDYCHCEWRTKSNNKWQGFKVGGIKPAYEPIIWAVKPPEGSYIDNVLKWGVGAVNVDECRIGLDGMEIHKTPAKSGLGKKGIYGKSTIEELTGKDLVRYTSKGRFPANVILSHHPECVQVGVKRVKGGKLNSICKEPYSSERTWSVSKTGKHEGKGFTDKDGLETVESWDCHPDCAVRLLDEQSGMLKSGARKGQISRPATNVYGKYKGRPLNCESSSGGASRFYYCAKSSRAERNAGLEGMEEKECFNLGHKDNPGRNAPKKSYPRANLHPCVKPIKLFEWLIKLVTREGQIILDPFIGSGTTAIAAYNAGRKCVGIEKEEEYIEIARRRAAHWRSRPKQLEMTGG